MVPAPALSSIMRKRVASESTLHDRCSTPCRTINDPICSPERRSLPPRRSSRSQSRHHSTMSEAAHQVNTALLSFILTVMRGPLAQSVSCGRATHTRAVVTGWWQGSFRRLTVDWAPFCWGSSSSQLLGQQPARCRGSSSFDRHLTVTSLNGPSAMHHQASRINR